MSHTISPLGRCGRQVKPSAFRCSTISVAHHAVAQPFVDRGDAQAAIHELPGPRPARRRGRPRVAGAQDAVALAFLEQHHEGFRTAWRWSGWARSRACAGAGCHRPGRALPGWPGEPGGGGAGEQHVQGPAGRRDCCRQPAFSSALASGSVKRLQKPERCFCLVGVRSLQHHPGDALAAGLHRLDDRCGAVALGRSSTRANHGRELAREMPAATSRWIRQKLPSRVGSKVS